MASISSLEFESKIVVSRSLGPVNLGELKKWVIIPLFCFIPLCCTSHLFCHEIQGKVTIGNTGKKVTFYLMSSTYSSDYEKLLNITKKTAAKVLYVPYVKFDSVIEKALSECDDETMMVLNSDSNTTAMRACAFIGKHLNQRAIDIEGNMRTSEVVDFKVKGSSKEWIKISKQYQLSTSSKFINEKAGVVVGDEAKGGWEEEEEEGEREEEEAKEGEEVVEDGEEGKEEEGGEEGGAEEEDDGGEEEEEEEGEEEEEEEGEEAEEGDEGGEGGEEEAEKEGTEKRGKRNAHFCVL